VIDYAPEIKDARMAVVRDALVGGKIELLEGRYVLARIPLGTGVVRDGTLSFGVSEGVATMKGAPTDARFIDYYAQTVADGLRVGVDVLLDEDTILVGQTVRVISATIKHA
jgi:hypothetical protein